jgi:ribonuclease J
MYAADAKKGYRMDQDNNNTGRNAPEETPAAQEKKIPRRRPYNRRRPARRPAQEQPDGLWSGSRDILGSPEIRLSEQTAQASDTQSDAGAQTEPEAAAESGKRTERRAGHPKGTGRDGKKSSPAAAVSPEAGDTASGTAAKAPARRGRRPAAKKAAQNVKTAQAAPQAEQKSRTQPASDAAQEQPAAAQEGRPRKPRSGGRGRKNVPAVVSAVDSIVRDAEIVRHEGNTLHVRRMGGELTYIPKAKLRIIPLGGLNEIGKNMTVVEYGDDIVVIDCGIGFPDEDEMPGIDLVIPDTTYLENNRDRIRGIVLTHGHEDHIGAIPYVLQKLSVPIYGTRLTLGIIENKLQEHTLPWKADLRCVKAGDVIRLGASFTVEFIHVNHSIADACALAINTPLGMLVHTGDFKLDLTPIDGEMMNVTRLGELGRDGVLLLMCESTNAERPGHTPSEKKVGKSLEMIFSMNPEKRIVIATFSSNVHRVQQIIDISARHGRKVAVTGRSMTNIVAAAVELGYMTVPAGVLIDISEIRQYRPDQLTLITTGSQGEPMSALYRMAFGDHNQVTLGPSDLVVLSASAIPGNEKLVGRVINELAKMEVQVINDSSVEVHVSGHACQEELKLMQGLIRPRYLMPVHGEYKHLAANRELGLAMGIPSDHIFISDIGKVLEIDEAGAKWGGTVPSGIVLVDGYGVGDVGNIVLRDRKHLAQDGLIVVVATVDENAGQLVSGPDIVSRGFVYVRESEDMMDEVRRIAAAAINNCIDRHGCDWYEIKNRIKDDVSRFLYTRTKRKPMILPIVMDV